MMERRLLTVIINPAMVASWGLGLVGVDRRLARIGMAPRQASACHDAFGTARLLRALGARFRL